MANLYCERCGESQEQKVWYEPNIRPNFIMCSTECVYNHLDEIENGEWDNYEGGNLRLEYANEIKNNPETSQRKLAILVFLFLTTSLKLLSMGFKSLILKIKL